MGDITKGFAFSGSSPNNAVTAANLNNLVDAATIQPSLIAGKVEKTIPAGGDYLLIWDSVSNTLERVSVQNLVPQLSSRAGFSGLNIINQAGTSASVLTIESDDLVMVTSSGAARLVLGFSESLNILATPLTVNGPDATVTASTWLHIYAISNGVLDGVYCSTSLTPTFPLGYIYSARLSAWRVDATVSLVLGEVIQKQAIMNMGSAGSSGANAAFQNPYIGSPSVEFSNATVPTVKQFTSIDLTRCIPPNVCARVQGIFGQTAGSAAAVGWAALPNSNGTDLMDATSITTNRGMVCGVTALPPVATSFFGFKNASNFDVQIDVQNLSQEIFFAWDRASASDYSMRITGYTLI